jgi:single-stranded-DNA-specific exonuclease
MLSGRVDEFRQRLNAYAVTRLTAADFIPTLLVDAAVTLDEITEQAAMEAISLQPFGAGNPRPLLVALDVEICGQPVWMKEKHVRFPVRQRGRTIQLKAWNFVDRAAELVAGTRIDVVFELDEDAYSLARGYAGWSATVKDMNPVVGC